MLQFPLQIIPFLSFFTTYNYNTTISFELNQKSAINYRTVSVSFLSDIPLTDTLIERSSIANSREEPAQIEASSSFFEIRSAGNRLNPSILRIIPLKGILKRVDTLEGHPPYNNASFDFFQLFFPLYFPSPFVPPIFS